MLSYVVKQMTNKGAAPSGGGITFPAKTPKQPPRAPGLPGGNVLGDVLQQVLTGALQGGGAGKAASPQATSSETSSVASSAAVVAELLTSAPLLRQWGFHLKARWEAGFKPELSLCGENHPGKQRTSG